MKKYIFLLTSLCLMTTASANLPMGQWQTHLAYNNVVQIAQSDNILFAVSEGALFSIDKSDGFTESYSKIDGLSDANIASISYDEVNKQLLIIYSNGNIDILHENGVSNIPDLMNKQMSSSKTIYHINFKGDMAYLSTNFGILLLNMEKKEISDTYIIGPNATEVRVISTLIHEDKIYALTNNYVYTADANSQNLVNYEYWQNTPGFPGTGFFQQITSFGGRILILRNGKLYRQESDKTWTQLLSSLNLSYITVSHGRLIVGDQSSTIYLMDENYELSTQTLVYSPDAEYDPINDTYWLAAQELGVISFQMKGSGDPVVNYYKPTGPAVNNPFDITFAGKKMFMVNGGRWAAQDGKVGQLMIRDEQGRWTNIDGKDIEAITGHSALDFMNVAVDPDDDSHFFVTSFGTGLYEFENNSFSNWYNVNNSPLHSMSNGAPHLYTRLDGAIFDKDRNLLFCNMGTNNSIKILSPEGEWGELTFPHQPLPHETLGKIVISNQNPNQKWVPSKRLTPGILIWDDKGTLFNKSDDQWVFINRFADVDNPGNFIQPSYFYSIAQDKNGVFWVGTDVGPLLFYSPSRAFDPEFTGSRVKIPRNDGTIQADYLLVNEKIKVIAIDGANRKWLGTESSGIYLMSENGQETLQHFTSTNSPLLSNNIMSIEINHETGEVFIGTSGGLISYQSDAAGSTGVFGDVYAYPNPVREDYNGIITITGLIDNARVKITDINGNLIYQTVANGSIATWDGKNVYGNKVNTGIYMAICASEDGLQSTITKIMVIN